MRAVSIVKPAGRDVLATAAADSIVVGSDARARGSSAYFWDRGRPWTSAVIKAVTQCEDPVVRSLGRELTEDPADPARYFALRSALISADRRAK